MLKKFYIAGSYFKTKSEVRTLAELLQAHGFEITGDWYLHIRETVSEFPRYVVEDIEGVAAADTFVLVAPFGYGSSTELGAAIALKKRIFYVPCGEPSWNIFLHHPSVEVFYGVKDFLEFILDEMIAT